MVVYGDKVWEGVFYFLPRFLYKKSGRNVTLFCCIFFHTTKVQQFPETAKFFMLKFILLKKYYKTLAYIKIISYLCIVKLKNIS